MPFAGKLRELQAALLAVLFVFSLGVVGVFYFADGLASLLATRLNSPWGKLIVGAVAAAPMLVLVLARLASTAAREKEGKQDLTPSSFMQSGDLPDSLRELLETVQRLTRSAPLAAIALAVVAGVVVIRHPAYIPLVLGILREQQR
ncbi:MAG: hypothetical protein JNJ73_07215 [Hyphomonadaceae bacterium]|nr:hypothetical protein [Hyphomonadaceae bacterium]